MSEIRDYTGKVKDERDYDFNDYMESRYGIHPMDLDDDDYDRAYAEYSEWRRAIL